MTPYDLTPQVAADIGKIWDHDQAAVSAHFADEHVARMDATIRRAIVLFPNAGRPRPEFGAGVRSYPILPYVFFYRVTRGRVAVLRILHGKRDIRQPLMSLLLAG